MLVVFRWFLSLSVFLKLCAYASLRLGSQYNIYDSIGSLILFGVVISILPSFLFLLSHSRRGSCLTFSGGSKSRITEKNDWIRIYISYFSRMKVERAGGHIRRAGKKAIDGEYKFKWITMRRHKYTRWNPQFLSLLFGNPKWIKLLSMHGLSVISRSKVIKSIIVFRRK